MVGAITRVDSGSREWNAGTASNGNAASEVDTLLEKKRTEESAYTLSKQDDKEASSKKLEQEVDKLNEQLKSQTKALRFKYSEDAGKYYVQVINPATQEVVESIPPEYLLELSVKMKDLIGLFIDKKL